eukprot:gene21037-3237_t
MSESQTKAEQDEDEAATETATPVEESMGKCAATPSADSDDYFFRRQRDEKPTTHPEGSTGRQEEEDKRIQEKARENAGNRRGVGKEPTTLTTKLASKMQGFWTKTKDLCSLVRAGPELSFQVGPYVVESFLTEAGVNLAVFLASERFHELRYAVDGTTDIQYTTNTFNHIRLHYLPPSPMVW